MSRRGAARLPLVLAAVVLALQIAYPLLGGTALTRTTIATVLVFAAASLLSALLSHGRRAAVALVVVAGGGGLVAEAVGVATGVPFGAYAYAGTLGPQVLGVPVIVPAAWLMMAWPCLLAGRAVAGAAGLARGQGRGRDLVAVVLAAWALASWDLFLDPQMVAAGHWRWAHPSPALPGVPGIPLTNFAGWLAVAVVMQALLHAAVPSVPADLRRPEGAGAPALLLGWTWLGSGLANLVFFDRPEVGVWGLVCLGLVVGPYLVLLRRSASGRRPAVPVPAGTSAGTSASAGSG